MKEDPKEAAESWARWAEVRLGDLSDETVLEELLAMVTDRINTVKGHNG